MFGISNGFPLYDLPDDDAPRAVIAEWSDGERESPTEGGRRDVAEGGGGANDEQIVDDAAMATADAESIDATTFIVRLIFVSPRGGGGGRNR